MEPTPDNTCCTDKTASKWNVRVDTIAAVALIIAVLALVMAFKLTFRQPITQMFQQTTDDLDSRIGRLDRKLNTATVILDRRFAQLHNEVRAEFTRDVQKAWVQTELQKSLLLLDRLQEIGEPALKEKAAQVKKSTLSLMQQINRNQ